MSFNEKNPLPTHQLAYQSLSEKILFGDLKPGDSITIQGVSEMLNVGITPVREALRRLISEGALQLKGNRRISIPAMTKKRLSDLIDIRLFLELEASKRALANIDEAQIKQLRDLDDRLDVAIRDGNVQEYLQLNYQFHFHLYHLAAYESAMPMIYSLWLQLGPYMRVICGRTGTVQMKDQHKLILDALVKNDSNMLCLALTDDIQQGAEILMDSAS